MLPLGGFVAFPDEDENSSIPADDPDLKRNRPLSQQALVVSAGILANLLLALLVLFGQFAVVGLPADPEPGVMVVNVQPGGAADAAGLRPETASSPSTTEGLLPARTVFSPWCGRSRLPRRRPAPEPRTPGQQRPDPLRPDEQQGEGRIGAQLQVNLSAASRPVSGPVELIRYTVSEFVQLIQQTVRGFAGLITNFQSTAGQLSGR